jgi:hypothetical protein
MKKRRDCDYVEHIYSNELEKGIPQIQFEADLHLDVHSDVQIDKKATLRMK